MSTKSVAKPLASSLATNASGVARVRGRLPFLLRISRSGRQVAQAALDWNAQCQSGQPFGSGTVSPPASIRRNGSFAFTERYSEDGGATRTDYVSALRGAFERGKATGTWRITVETRRKDTGAVTDSCDSGTIRWRAAR